MRVLFTTSPPWGHVHPMVPLARAFVEGGHEVRWATSADACERLHRSGFSAVPAGLSEEVSRDEFYRRFPEYATVAPADRGEFMFPRLFGTVRAGTMLTDLLPLAREFRPSIIIHEQGEFAAPLVAAMLKVPNVTHGFGSLVAAPKVAAAGAAVSSLWEEHGLEPRPYAGSYDYLYIDIYPPSLGGNDASHVPAVQPIRPVAFAGPGHEPRPEWIEADDSKPLVYVTFGTVFNKDISLFSAVVEGVRELPVRVVVTVGPAGDPSVLGAQPANVHVARYIPQTELLPHCSLVVSHGGSGTFLAALSQGLPHLCFPQAADQFYNAAACARSGAGLVLGPGQVSVESTRAAVEQLLADPCFRSAATQLRAEIEAMPSPNEVADQITTRWS